jgi:hypothetical protein
MRDETLAWLAVRDELQRRSNRTVSAIIIRIFGGRGRAAAREAVTGMRVRSSNRIGMEPPRHDFENQIPKLVSPHMVRYSLAVDEQAKKLTDAERVRLRSAGEVPEWFLPAVYAAAKNI